MTKLVVIQGGFKTGKMPLARKLLAEDPDLVCVHRDHLRDHLINSMDEWEISLLMADLARGVLRLGRSPVIVAWNLDPADRKLWTRVAAEADAELVWLDVRRPEVAAMIPLEQPS
jgi:predicted kinase